MDPLGEKYTNWSSYNFCLNNPLLMFDSDGMEPDEVDDVLNHLNKKQGYTIVTDNESKTTTVSKVSAHLSKDKISTSNNTNIVIQESVFQLDANGEIADISITETGISATIEDGKITATESEQISYQGSHADNINEMKTENADPLVDAVSGLMKSDNRGSLFNQDTGLPGKSLLDRVEKNIGSIIQGISVLTRTQAPGIEYYSPDISQTTVMQIPFDKSDKAINSFLRLSMKGPVIIN